MTTSRLQDQDFTYWFLKEAFGWSVVLQLVWTFDAAPPPNALERMNLALSDGPLNKRIVRPRVPLARPRWVRPPAGPDIAVDHHIVAVDDVQHWAAEELSSVRLDVDSGYPWRLRGAHTTDGGFVLSLSCLHLVADGQSLTSAAQAAMVAASREPTTELARSAATFVDSRNSAHDVVDAVAQVAGAAAGVGRAAATAWAARGDHAASTAPEMPRRTPMAERAPTATGSWAVVEVDAQQWAEVARAHGGTSNSLFVAVVAGALWGSGYTSGSGPVKVGIPMSLRGDGDDRANATGGVSVVLRERPTPGTDLGDIRRLCKEAFTALSAGRRPPMIHLQRLLQLLPLSVVTSIVMSGESGMPDVMVSNLGTFPDSARSLAGVQARAVAFRGTAQGVDAASPHRFGDGLQSWFLDVGGSATFSVLAFDETHVGSAERLETLLSAELTGWNVPHRFW